MIGTWSWEPKRTKGLVRVEHLSTIKNIRRRKHFILFQFQFEKTSDERSFDLSVALGYGHSKNQGKIVITRGNRPLTGA